MMITNSGISIQNSDLQYSILNFNFDNCVILFMSGCNY